MGRDAELLSLVSRVYAAAEDASQWPDFVAALMRATDCQAGGFYAIDLSSHEPILNAAMGIDRAFLESYEQHFAARNPWDAAAVASGRFLPGSVVMSDDLVSRSELQRTEYYADWLQPQQLSAAANVCLAREERFVANVTLLRPQDAGSFTTEDAQLLEALTPHVQRAVRLHQQLGGLRASTAAWQDVVDRLSTGIMLIGRSATVIHMNAAARATVRLRDGVSVNAEGAIELATTTATRDLRKLLTETVATALGCGLSSGGFFCAPRLTNGPLQMLVAPISAPDTAGVDAPAAVVFVTDPAAAAVVARDALRAAFGLTEAEAQLAARLASGERLSDVAAASHVSIHTVRTHLKNIFAKTGTHRQPELVQRILSSTAALR